MLIMGVLLVVYQKRSIVRPEEIDADAKIILQEIAENSSLRLEVLKYNPSLSREEAQNKEVIEKIRSIINQRLVSTQWH
jgi:hypothetical protein